jgi:hypothetical protein
MPPGSDQQLVDLDRLRGVAGDHVQGDPSPRAPHRQNLPAEAEVPALGGDLGEPCRDLVVLLAQQPWRPVDDRDLDPERGEDVRHLGTDVAPAEDAEAPGQAIQAHHRVAGEVGDVGKPGDQRDRGPAAVREHDLVGSQRLRAPPLVELDADLLWSDEAGRALEDGDVRAILDAVAPAGLGDRIDPAEDAVADRGPVDAQQLLPNAEASRLAWRVGDVGGVYEHLGRDAADVEAGSAERAALDDRDRPVVEAGIEDRVARAGADDAEVEVRHPHIVTVARTGKSKGCAEGKDRVPALDPRRADDSTPMPFSDLFGSRVRTA